jgi:hypothetical protein
MRTTSAFGLRECRDAQASQESQTEVVVKALDRGRGAAWDHVFLSGYLEV